MTGREVLLDLLLHLLDQVRSVITGMSLDALQWQPDPQANNIGVTLWHIGRSLDVLRARVLEKRSSREELWYLRGWALRKRYDPTGLGFAGLGNLAGYTRAQVEALPALTADELLQYFGQACEALRVYLRDMPNDHLYRPPAGLPALPSSAQAPETTYLCIRDFLMDAYEHLGEIKAIKAMRERKNATT